MQGAALQARLARAAEGVDLVIVESSMGLFDGLALPDGRRGAASDIAAFLDIPVLLVLDASGQGQSVGAVAQGLAQWDDKVTVAGVILNNIASDRHEKLCRAALKQTLCGVFRRDVRFCCRSVIWVSFRPVSVGISRRFSELLLSRQKLNLTLMQFLHCRARLTPVKERRRLCCLPRGSASHWLMMRRFRFSMRILPKNGVKPGPRSDLFLH